MDETIKIFPVPADAFISHWTTVEPLLNQAVAVALRRYLAIDVLALMIQGQGQGWFVADNNELIAIMVTKVDQYPRRRGLAIFALAGTRMSEWFDKANEILSVYAKQMGCDHIEAQGRKGWERVLNLEPRSIFLVKDLTEQSELKDGGSDV